MYAINSQYANYRCKYRRICQYDNYDNTVWKIRIFAKSHFEFFRQTVLFILDAYIDNSVQ